MIEDEKSDSSALIKPFDQALLSEAEGLKTNGNLSSSFMNRLFGWPTACREPIRS